jgi:mannose-6-phosphate isomerase
MRERVDPGTYRGWIDRQERDRLLDALHRVPVRAGDVIFVPAGTPHAIGAGALIAELQEPTDFSIVCEWEGYPIAPDDSHLGLGWDVAIDALALGPQEPVLGLPEDARAFFWADERAEPAGRFAVWIVLDGSGTIAGESARRGDCFAVPAAADRIDVDGDLRVLRCLGPSSGV